VNKLSEVDFCFRVDANSKVGFGHLNRCLSLARHLPDDSNALFVIKAPADHLLERLRGENFHCLPVPSDINYPDEPEYLETQIDFTPHILVLDVSHDATLVQRDDFAHYLGRLRRFNALLVLIDGHRQHAVVTDSSFDIDVLITPYAGSTALPASKNRAIHCLAGLAYAIFSPDFAETANRPHPINREARKLLVTMGGSDPYRITPTVMQALKRAAAPALEVRIVQGPNFSADLVDEIASIGKQLPHLCELVSAPRSLVDHMFWCDLAVGTSGLTKYELALTGTPSILISIDDSHEDANTEFKALGTAWHLGVADSLLPDSLADALLRLVADAPTRREMANQGRRFVDGLGALRIIDAIESS